MSPFYISVFYLIFEISTYIFIIYGFAGISAFFVRKKNNSNILTDVIFPGFILYLTFFIIMRWLQLPANILISLLIAILIAGYILLFQNILKNWKFVKSLIIFTIIILLIYIGFYFIPSFTGGVDSIHYSMDMAWAMNLNWLKEHAKLLGWGSEGLFVGEMNYKRAAVSALGWLNNLSGLSINLGTVQRHIMIYLILTIVQFYRIIPTQFQKTINIKSLWMVPFLLILPGAHYVHSISNLGQLNAAFGIFLLVSIIVEIINLNQSNWKWHDSWRLCLLTFVLFLSYMEIIFILPLFVIIAFLFPQKITIKGFFKTLIPLALGVFPIFIFKFHYFWEHIIQQSKGAVGAYPLGIEFNPNLLNVASNLLGSTYNEKYGFLGIIIVTVLFVLVNLYCLKQIFGKNRKTAIKLGLLWFFVIYYVVFVYFSINTTLNPSYVLFKMSSWTSPLLAITAMVLWLNILTAKSSIFIKGSYFSLIFFIALFSGYNSTIFLSRYTNAPPQQFPHSIISKEIIELHERDSQGRLLYDQKWVENLAPWNNVPIIFAEK